MSRKFLMPILAFGFLISSMYVNAGDYTHTDGATYTVTAPTTGGGTPVSTSDTHKEVRLKYNNKGEVTDVDGVYYYNTTNIVTEFEDHGTAVLKTAPKVNPFVIPNSVYIEDKDETGVIKTQRKNGNQEVKESVTYVDKDGKTQTKNANVYDITGTVYVDEYYADVTSIGASAFSGNTLLTSIVIPAAIVSIGDQAFYGCTALSNLTFMTPGNLESIGEEAFYNCTNLCDVYVPASVNHLGWRVFSGCSELAISFEPNSQLTSIKNDGTITKNYNYSEYEGGYIEQASNVKNGVFKGTTVKYLVLPDHLDTLPGCEFLENTTLQSIYIPGNLKVIGPEAFMKSALCTIEFETPSQLKSIGYHAFGHMVSKLGCSLTSIDIPASVEEIQAKAFHETGTLKDVTFNRTVTNPNADGEIDIYFGYNSPDGQSSPTPFDGVANDVIYTIPCGMADAYTKAARWGSTDNTKTPNVNRCPCVYTETYNPIYNPNPKDPKKPDIIGYDTVRTPNFVEKGFDFKVNVHGVNVDIAQHIENHGWVGKISSNPDVKVVAYDPNDTLGTSTNNSYDKLNCEKLFLVAHDNSPSIFSRWVDKTHNAEIKNQSILVDMDNDIYLTAYYNLVLEPGVNYSSLTKANSLCDTLILMGNNNDVATFDAAAYSLKANAIKIKRTFDATKFYYFSLPFDCKGSDIEVVDETLIDVKDKYDSDESYTIDTDKWIIYQYNESSLSGGAQFEDGASYTAVSDINNFTFRRGIGYAIGVICDPTDDETDNKVTITFPCSAEQALTLTGFDQDIEIEQGLSVTKNGTDERYYGWNLVGSPSLKEIDASNFLQKGWGDDVQYFSFLTSHNRYSQVKAAGSLTVPPFRPFFLQLEEPSIVVLASNSVPMFAPAANGNRYEDRQIVVTLSNDFERYDETTLLADEDAADGYVINEDLAKLFSQGVPSIYSYWEGYEYAFNMMNFANVHREIPIGVRVYEQGQYTIALDKDKTNFGDVVYLNDTKLNKRVNLLKNNYRVSMSPGDDNGRFILEIDYVPTGVADVDEESGVMAYVMADKLRVENIADGSMVSVYDMAGRLVVSRYADGSFECELPVRGAYIVKVVSDNSSNSVKVIY